MWSLEMAQTAAQELQLWWHQLRLEGSSKPGLSHWRQDLPGLPRCLILAAGPWEASGENCLRWGGQSWDLLLLPVESRGSTEEWDEAVPRLGEKGYSAL